MDVIGAGVRREPGAGDAGGACGVAPEGEQLHGLVRASLFAFDAAVKAGDFTAFMEGSCADPVVVREGDDLDRGLVGVARGLAGGAAHLEAAREDRDEVHLLGLDVVDGSVAVRGCGPSWRVLGALWRRPLRHLTSPGDDRHHGTGSQPLARATPGPCSPTTTGSCGTAPSSHAPSGSPTTPFAGTWSCSGRPSSSGSSSRGTPTSPSVRSARRGSTWPTPACFTASSIWRT